MNSSKKTDGMRAQERANAECWERRATCVPNGLLNANHANYAHDDWADATVYAMRHFPKRKRTLWTRIKAAWRGMLRGWRAG